MSDRDSDSGSQTPSREDTIEHLDVTPKDSVSQYGSSMSRASHAARRTAAEVRDRVARQRAAQELRLAAIHQEIAEMEAEGEKDALDTGDEAFERELRNTDTLSRRSACGSRGVNHCSPDGQMRRVQVEETRASCMVMCGPGGGSVDRSSSGRSLIPRRLFGDYEGDSQTMIDEESHGTRSNETTRPEPPCATEDTEEGRRNRIEAWVAKATTQDTAWESSEELSYQDQDVRLKQPEQGNSHVTTASQRRSELRMDLPSGKRASIASQRTDRDGRAPENKTRTWRHHQCVRSDDNLKTQATKPRDVGRQLES